MSTTPAAQTPRPLRSVAGLLCDVAHAYGGVVGSRAYFPLWLGQLASSFGDTLHYIALVVLVFQLTGQGIPVAGLVAAEVVPVLVLGPIAGGRHRPIQPQVCPDRGRPIPLGPRPDATLAAGAWHAYLVAAGMAAGNLLPPNRPGSHPGVD